MLVVGAGAAGLYTALCIPQKYHVGLITKETVKLSASDWAQGGIAAAVSPDDSPQLHVEDTLRAGVGLCSRPAVEFLAHHAPDCVRDLVNLGVTFDRRGNDLALTLEAAHSRHRVLHAADTTGRAVISTLTAQVLNRCPQIQVIQQALALRLWHNQTTGQVQGICLFYQGQVQWIRAQAVILATGGGGQVFAQTTNPAVSTGDGVAIAWRSGAILRDLEFFQFHPTALTKAGADRFLISEAVRGEGAHLVDDTGRRFVFDYHPDGELAPRDVVSRAIYNHLQKTATDPTTANVWLDLRPIPEERIRHRFPNIIQVCAKWDIDVFQEPIPVAPAAHYWMGGILTDTNNRTNIPGLYAIGETASTGVHGANRLASNSLLECIVFGAQMAHLEVEKNNSQGLEDISKDLLLTETATAKIIQQDEWVQELRHQIPKLMWQSAGICRTQAQLIKAQAIVEKWREEFTHLEFTSLINGLQPGKNIDCGTEEIASSLKLWAETENLLDIAYLILKSAAYRTESRGGHYRQDYPHTDPNWQAHTLIQHQKWWKSPELD